MRGFFIGKKSIYKDYDGFIKNNGQDRSFGS